jgi:uncharacterized membrane protein YhaH (DUF805 family)
MPFRPARPLRADPPHALSRDEVVAIAIGAGPGRLGLRPLYFGLHGRITRATFWLHGVAGLFWLGVLLVMLLEIAGVPADTAAALAVLLLVWPNIAISVKRLHDFDFSGWWAAANLVAPLGSLVVMLVDGIVPGTRGPNRFGADPRVHRHVRQ